MTKREGVVYKEREIKSSFINSTRSQEQIMYDGLRWFGLIAPIFLFYVLYIDKQGDIKAVLGICAGIWVLVRIAQNANT